MLNSARSRKRVAGLVVMAIMISFAAGTHAVAATRYSSSSGTIRYQLPAGQRMAYKVTIDWQEGNNAHRITATPYYNVRYQTGSKSTMMVIARFRHFIKGRSDTEYRYYKDRDFWLPTIQTLGMSHVEVRGNKAVGQLRLPYLMLDFADPNLLCIPPLPKVMNRKLGKEEPAVIDRSARGATLWEGFTRKSGSGRVFRYKEAKPSGSSVKLETESGYNDTGTSIYYQSTATLDARTGLLQSCRGTYTVKLNNKTTVATITVRKLTGSELNTATQEAITEIGQLPKSLIPTQLARKPVELHLPPKYTMATLPPAGTTVAYYDRDLNQRFAVIYEKPVDSKRVQIRYVGSNERQTVSATAIAKMKP